MVVKNQVQSLKGTIVIATLLLEEWENDIHTPEMGTWEFAETPEVLEFDFRGQNTSH